MTVQSAFEDVLASSSEGAGLPADMRRTETVVRDLRQVVRFSTLPSKNELEFEFSGFIDTARKASGDLTRFNSRIGRAVDHILSTNRWTLQVIEGVTEREENRGALARIMDNAPWPLAARQTPREALVDQYLRHTRAVEEEIAQLISEAQALLGILENLDERLDAIHGIAMRDGLSTQGRREELFAQLWTKLGGNRAQAAKLEAQLRLLKDVHTYRQTAWAHVSATVLKLEAIAAGLEDLRERVAAPETAGEVAPDLPITLHIDNIMRGVERLEQQRDTQRRIQLEGYRRVLERGGSGDERMIEGKNGH
ncbi:uncharacterized protein K452DRAFT_289329 [Aplosporella prunicola CBS 121167]|uniref:Uncharacterized protein n=1 Tax=Aplosporella prunicola CBS 121167 TaxID=1176127 RepID=A0A6A6B7D5_9PEZI|nr:uncharacterized protein K452DRAFT_289329 [Aplosporella prunicola CBS 121167]KAF2139950.1 hypothetical protein K452DRAFT_289329 [Aplosporella prunicola CBS 121167]